MKNSQDILQTRTLPRHAVRRAFSLIEMLVAITILVLIILSVGMIFQSTSKSVGVSQATMEMLSNVRSVQQQLAKDISQMDRSQFLVIRSRRVVDPTYGLRRFDQIAFIANGTFFNRSGILQTAPFSDSTSGTTAHIWWGQPAIEVRSVPAKGNYLASNEAVALARNAPPSGDQDSEFIIARHETLLFPNDRNSGTAAVQPAGNTVPAYESAFGVPGGPYALGWSTPTISPSVSEGLSAHITSSRFAVAGMSGADVLRSIFYQHSIGNQNFEALEYCYRFKVLRSVYDTECSTSNALLNGYFRMTPIALQGAPSFSVQWTDGTVDTTQTPPGQKWYGVQEDGSINHSPSMAEERNGILGTLGDDYVAVFAPENRRGWPKALRITFRVVDAGKNQRLQPKEFTQVINLPD